MRTNISYIPIRSVNFARTVQWVLPAVIVLLGVGLTLGGTWLQQSVVFRDTDTATLSGLPSLLLAAMSWILLRQLTRTVNRAELERQHLSLENRKLHVLNAIGEATAQSLDLDTVLKLALERIVDLIGMPAAEIRLVEGNRLVLKASAGTSASRHEHPNVPLGECVCGRCARAGEMITIADLATDPFLVNIACARDGYRTLVTIPVKSSSQAFGVILLANTNPNVLKPEERDILEAIGSRLGVAIENARLYEQARRRALHLDTANRLGRRANGLLELDALLPEAVKLIQETFGYYQVSILLVDKERNDLVMREASGPNAEAIKQKGIRLKIGQEGIVGWVAHTGKALLSNDVSSESHYLPIELAPETQSEVAVPLRIGKQVIGVLDVQSSRRDAFDKEDLTLLRILGYQVAVMIENAKLFQQTRDRYEAMVALHEISLEMISELNTRQLLEGLLRRGTMLLGAQAAGLVLFENKQGQFLRAISYNTSRDWTAEQMPFAGLAEEVMQTGKPLIVNDYPTWPNRVAEFEKDPLSRKIGVPLTWNDQTIGVLEVMNERGARPFDHNDAWLLSHFADLASIVMKNAELHSQIRELSEELEQRVEARTLELSQAKEEVAARSEQLRLLLAKTIRVQEDERARMARDMHDGVVQLVTGARYELLAAGMIDRNQLSAPAREKFDTAAKLLDEVEIQIRHAIYDLHPPSLDAIGLGMALKKHSERFSRISGIECSFQMRGKPVRLSDQAESSIYRWVEEALSNVATHAHANNCSVLVHFEPNMLHIWIEDDGCGFDYAEARKSRDHNGHHLGLLSMEERVESLRGTMEIASVSGQGTRLIFRLPIEDGVVEWEQSAS